MGLCPARPVHLHLAWNRGGPPALAPGAQVFPGHSASAGVGDLLKRMIGGKTRGPVWCREGFPSPDPAQGPCDPRLISVRWGSFPRGRPVLGVPACACAALGLGLKPARRGLEKSHLLGVSPLFFHP